MHRSILLPFFRVAILQYKCMLSVTKFTELKERKHKFNIREKKIKRVVRIS